MKSQDILRKYFTEYTPLFQHHVAESLQFPSGQLLEQYKLHAINSQSLPKVREYPAPGTLVGNVEYVSVASFVAIVDGTQFHLVVVVFEVDVGTTTFGGGVTAICLRSGS